MSAAVAYLVGRYAQGATLDFSRVIIATSGAEAGRRLLEQLVTVAESAQRAVIPPEIVTLGQLPEKLYTPKRPFANDLTQQFTWVEALRALDATELSPLLPFPPPEDDRLGLLAIAKMLATLHKELAAARHAFADVLACGKRLPSFTEQARWQVLSRLQLDYLRRLDELELWDIQTARIEAIRLGECETDRDILLLGTVDMTQTLRGMLDAPKVVDHVTALISAPTAWADRFDSHGCLVSERWIDEVIDIDDDRIEIVDGPGDQADAVVREIARYQGRFSADEITIGLADERLVPWIQQRLDECGLTGRFGAGMSLVRSGVCKLLTELTAWLDGRPTTALTALVRHPHLERALRMAGADDALLSLCDAYVSEHLPARIDERLLKARGTPVWLRNLVATIDQWTTALQGEPRPLGDWGEAVVGVLIAIYGQRELHAHDETDRQTLAACDAIERHCRLWREVPRTLAPRVSGSEALTLLLEALSVELIPERTAPGSIELLGWLELPLDDAPALVVVGCNEGIVPQSCNGDTFLPNELRRRLHVEDNDQRYARDAYALGVLAATRTELRVIAGRRDSERQPLIPSRLLLATHDDRLACRTMRFFSQPPSRRPLVLPRSIVSGAQQPRFAIPHPKPLPAPIDSMRVTEFRDYIACPYRYYLRHVLKLKAFDDTSHELDDAQFGSLIHDVLKAFGESDLRDTRQQGTLEDFLSGTLEELVAERFPGHAMSAVEVQIEQVHRRLQAFAAWQVERSRNGFRICYVEHEALESSFEVDGRAIKLRGRIDRIDHCDATGCWELLDYKTGRAATSPEAAHYAKNRGWIDLQLPLYLHLARDLNLPGQIRLGYILVPEKLAEVQSKLADWDQAALAEAYEEARRIVRCVRQEIFWPPNREPPPFSEPFAGICLDDQFASAMLPATGDDDEEDD